ncbi:hypothetical protein ACFXDJ_06170 [Streptomyces sp. NPDC059443]|uniref:hypothetical protein n=1 Tax=unclassified Streptomyces TaxID=2593676 RepID=UPI0036AD6514
MRHFPQLQRGTPDRIRKRPVGLYTATDSQVTGVRQDPYARANPHIVEQGKSEGDRGKYLHPEAWGKPQEAGLHHERQTALFEQTPPKGQERTAGDSSA